MTSDITHDYGHLKKRVRLDYICKYCDLSYDTEERTMQHVEQHHKEKIKKKGKE